MGCRVELPRLQPLYDTYRDKGFVILAVEGKRDTPRARRFIADKHLTFTFVENGQGDAEVAARLYGIRGYPSCFLIDRQGRVEYFHEGFEEGDEARLEAEVKRLL
jgi:cytochrome c biogenesis protein CcmG/thiol:disulfide interchange protein DsbE